MELLFVLTYAAFIIPISYYLIVVKSGNSKHYRRKDDCDIVIKNNKIVKSVEDYFMQVEKENNYQ